MICQPLLCENDKVANMHKYTCTHLFPYSSHTVESRVLRREHIIMGTSGTVLDWVLKKRVIDPKKIAMFVLDEADIMIDQQGQQDQTIRIQK